MKDKLVNFEIWMAEHPAVDGSLKCFSLDKEAAIAYARELGPEAGVWDMMSSYKGTDGNDPKKKD